MASNERQTLMWLENAKKNAMQGFFYQPLQFMQWPEEKKRVLLVGAGPSTLSLKLKDVPANAEIIANQSSLPWLLQKKFRVDTVILSDGGEGVWNRISSWIGHPELRHTKWVIPTQVDPRVWAALKRYASRVYCYHAFLVGDNHYNDFLCNAYDSNAPLGVAQAGNVINMSLLILNYFNIMGAKFEVYLKGVDMGYPQKQERIPTFIRVQENHVIMEQEKDSMATHKRKHTDFPYVTSAQHIQYYEQLKIVMGITKYPLFTVDDNVLTRLMPQKGLSGD